MDKQKISAVILAGGRASRMHQQDKGLVLLNSVPLVQQVLAVVIGQVSDVKISANRHVEQYKSLTNCTVLPDEKDGFKGPLMGILTGMRACDTEYLFLVPCDAPKLSASVLERLSKAMESEDEVCVAHDGELGQYTFALFRVSTTDKIQQQIDDGVESFRILYKRLKTKFVDCSDIKECFTNVNTAGCIALQTAAYLYKEVPVLGFVGFSGSGKTTLLTQVIAQLKSHKKQVAVIKHSHHNVDLDSKGKDSYRFRESGANQVIVGSSKRFALLVEHDHAEADLSELLTKLDVRGLDFILFEGFKHDNFPKIEVHRSVTGYPTLWQEDSHIIALASDKLSDTFCDVPLLDINSVSDVSEFVLRYEQNT